MEKLKSLPTEKIIRHYEDLEMENCRLDYQLQIHDVAFDIIREKFGVSISNLLKEAEEKHLTMDDEFE